MSKRVLQFKLHFSKYQHVNYGRHFNAMTAMLKNWLAACRAGRTAHDSVVVEVPESSDWRQCRSVFCHWSCIFLNISMLITVGKLTCSLYGRPNCTSFSCRWSSGIIGLTTMSKRVLPIKLHFSKYQHVKYGRHFNAMTKLTCSIKRKHQKKQI